MEKIRIGIIGCGFIANAHYIGYKSNRDCEVVAVADISEEAAVNFAKKYGIGNWYASVKDMIGKEDIDAVSICTPHIKRVEVVREVASAGKHILVEKPLATTVDEALAMIDITSKAKVKFMVGFVTRFSAPNKEAKDLVDIGAIGRVIGVSSFRLGSIPWSDWYADPTRGGGILSDRFCYGVDFARWFTGSEVQDVFTHAGTLVHKDVLKKYGNDFFDSAQITMRMKNGVLIQAEESYAMKNIGYYEQVRVIGEEGLIQANPFKHDMVTLFSTKNNPDPKVGPFSGIPYSAGWNWPDLSFFIGNDKFGGAFANEVRAFLDCIINDTEPPVTGKDGLENIKVVNAALESHRKGELIKL